MSTLGRSFSLRYAFPKTNSFNTVLITVKGRKGEIRKENLQMTSNRNRSVQHQMLLERNADSVRKAKRTSDAHSKPHLSSTISCKVTEAVLIA